MFMNQVKINLSGDGGNGIVAYRRENMFRSGTKAVAMVVKVLRLCLKWMKD